MSGFVYLWYDRKHNRYYVGSHWGPEDDGYICSSRWMRKAYRRRPEDFKRRIISRIVTTRQDLLNEEYRWLDMIKDHELKHRYYNLRKWHAGHWSSNPQKLLEISEKISKIRTGKPNGQKGTKRNPHSEETKYKISNSLKGRQFSEEHLQNLKKPKPWQLGKPSHRKGKKASEETRQKISQAKKGNPSPMLGKKHSETSREKMRLARHQYIETLVI